MSFHSPISVASAAFTGTSTDDQPSCTLWYIRRQLGRGDYGDRRMVSYVCKLISAEGFPPPLPSLVKRQLTREVNAHSRWIKSAVDAWILDFLPPANAAAVDRVAMAAAAAAMDRAAEGLGRLTVIDGGRA